MALLLNSNPLENIAATSDIFMLIRQGQSFSKQDLDDLLSNLKELNNGKQ